MIPAAKRVRLKCRYEGEIRTVTLLPGWNFQQLKKRLSQDYGFEVSMKYEDREGDLIILSSQNDFDDLLIGEPDTVNVHIFESTLPDLNIRGSSRLGASTISNIFPVNVGQSQANTTAGVSSLFPGAPGGSTTPNPSTLSVSTSNLRQLNTASSFSGRHVTSASSNNHMMRMTPTARSQQVDRFPQIDGHINSALAEVGIRWKRGEVLGQGAFGIVYLGLNIETGELMAVKQMAMDEVATKTLSSLENEIYFLRSLRHPNIVRYIDTEITSTALSIFLEYVPGGSLKSLVDKFGALEESVAKSYTRQLLLGLEYLHRNGIAHRDIKGGNCLVGNDGVVKLADFGNSKHWRPTAADPLGDGGLQQVSGDIKGTPSWMAPEVIRDQGGAIQWKKADIWSLACTTIEMATGKPPWSQFTNSVTILYHIACQETIPDYPANASMELITFLNTCLQRDPTRRPDTTSLLLHTFVSTIGGGMGWNNAGIGARPTTVSSALVEGDWGLMTTRAESRAESAARFSVSSRMGLYGGGGFTPGPGTAGLGATGFLAHTASSNRLINTATSTAASSAQSPLPNNSIIPSTGELVNYSHTIAMNPLAIPVFTNSTDLLNPGIGSPLFAESYTLAECDDGEETPRLSRLESGRMRVPLSSVGSAHPSTSSLLKVLPTVNNNNNSNSNSNNNGSNIGNKGGLNPTFASRSKLDQSQLVSMSLLDESGELDGPNHEIEALTARSDQWDPSPLVDIKQQQHQQQCDNDLQLVVDLDDMHPSSSVDGAVVVPVVVPVVFAALANDVAVPSPPAAAPSLGITNVTNASARMSNNRKSNKSNRSVTGTGQLQSGPSSNLPVNNSIGQEQQQVANSRRKSGLQRLNSSSTGVTQPSNIVSNTSSSSVSTNAPNGNQIKGKVARKPQGVLGVSGTTSRDKEKSKNINTSGSRGGLSITTNIISTIDTQEFDQVAGMTELGDYAYANLGSNGKVDVVPVPKSCPPQVQSSKDGSSGSFPFPSPERSAIRRNSYSKHNVGDEDMVSLAGGATTTDYDETSDGALGDNDSYGSAAARRVGNGHDLLWGENCAEVDTDLDEDPDDNDTLYDNINNTNNNHPNEETVQDDELHGEIKEDTPEKLASLRANRSRSRYDDEDNGVLNGRNNNVGDVDVGMNTTGHGRKHSGQLNVLSNLHAMNIDHNSNHNNNRNSNPIDPMSSFGIDSDDRDANDADSDADIVEDDCSAVFVDNVNDSETGLNHQQQQHQLQQQQEQQQQSINQSNDPSTLSMRHVPGRLLEPLANPFALSGKADPSLALGNSENTRAVRQGGFRSGQSNGQKQKTGTSQVSSSTPTYTLKRSTSISSLEGDDNLAGNDFVVSSATTGVVTATGKKQRNPGKKRVSNLGSKVPSAASGATALSTDVTFSVGGVGYGSQSQHLVSSGEDIGGTARSAQSRARGLSSEHVIPNVNGSGDHEYVQQGHPGHVSTAPSTMTNAGGVFGGYGEQGFLQVKGTTVNASGMPGMPSATSHVGGGSSVGESNWLSIQNPSGGHENRTSLQLQQQVTRTKRNVVSSGGGSDVAANAIFEDAAALVGTGLSLKPSYAEGSMLKDPAEGTVFSPGAPPIPSLFDSFTPVVLEEHTASITKLRCPGKTNLLVSGSNDGTIRVWNGCGTDVNSKLIVDANNFSSGAITGSGSTGAGGGGGSSSSSSIRVLTVWAEDQCAGLWGACSDGGLRLWSGVDGKPIRYVKAHDDTINAIEGCVEGVGSGGGGIMSGTAAQSNNLVGTGSSDKTVRIWDMRAKKPQVFLLRGHADAVVALRWADGGRTVLSASRDKTVKIWDTRAGRMRVSLERHFGAVNALRTVPGGFPGAVPGQSLAVAAAGSGSAEKSNVAFVSAGRDSMINLWSDDGNCLATLTAHRGTVNFLSEVNFELQLKPSNSSAATAVNSQFTSPLMLSTGSDNAIKIWDLKKMRAASEISVVGSGSLTKAVWVGPSVVACTNSGAVKLYQYAPLPSSVSFAGIGGPGSPGGDVISSSMQGIPFSDDASVGSLQGGGGGGGGGIKAAEWITKDLGMHNQACTDLLSTDHYVATASKNGQIFRWTRNSI